MKFCVHQTSYKCAHCGLIDEAAGKFFSNTPVHGLLIRWVFD